MNTPQFEAAMAYMADKGYEHAEFIREDHVEDAFCWYFLFGIEDGVVELETEYVDGGWRWEVTRFWRWSEYERRAG